MNNMLPHSNKSQTSKNSREHIWCFATLYADGKIVSSMAAKCSRPKIAYKEIPYKNCTLLYHTKHKWEPMEIECIDGDVKGINKWINSMRRQQAKKTVNGYEICDSTKQIKLEVMDFTGVKTGEWIIRNIILINAKTSKKIEKIKLEILPEICLLMC